MAQLEGIVGEAGAARLDRYIADDMGLLSRSQFKARFVSAVVNGRDAKPSRPLKPGDRFVIQLLDEVDRSSASMPEDLPITVLYEDDQVLVVDKAQGMVVHPAHGNWSGTLANALLGRIGSAGAAAAGRHRPPAGQGYVRGDHSREERRRPGGACRAVPRPDDR